MNTFIEIVKIVGPAALVLYAVYLMVRAFLGARLDELSALTRQKNQSIVTPIRLQAYERITLLLERISPNNLVTRLNNPEFTALDFQQILVMEIRQEFNHNLAQQIYMSEEAWSFVQGAVEDTITMINEIGRGMSDKDKGLDLAKAIFEQSIAKNSIAGALSFLKNEIKDVF